MKPQIDLVEIVETPNCSLVLRVSQECGPDLYYTGNNEWEADPQKALEYFSRVKIEEKARELLGPHFGKLVGIVTREEAIEISGAEATDWIKEYRSKAFRGLHSSTTMWALVLMALWLPSLLFGQTLGDVITPGRINLNIPLMDTEASLVAPPIWDTVVHTVPGTVFLWDGKQVTGYRGSVTMQVAHQINESSLRSDVVVSEFYFIELPALRKFRKLRTIFNTLLPIPRNEVVMFIQDGSIMKFMKMPRR